MTSHPYVFLLPVLAAAYYWLPAMHKLILHTEYFLRAINYHLPF